jgi:hypothetical protein
MNKGYNEFDEQKITEFRRPPQVKSSKAQIFAKFHKIPTIRFEDQELTSFSGMIVFQLLFKRLGPEKKVERMLFPSEDIPYIWPSPGGDASGHPFDSGIQTVA